ncbi:carbon-nitrogen hydrolase family protein [Desulfurivibrio alkaliphilus]|uniref:Nitrilase/cyanide hydratase and apolipoprotein N-acyltransferase n=1 Tax=Desulfurivibrio alkaliphilus (strain DSM 19089 / UNIQEM U267 / AHT2) TaxID=589865 RepID=D6Z0H5_DESAT|nr:carbon-nitrogen hydrolase family protein [Desulfurivibrio alkaliphilus]ADH85204.1 Nitrilase/cyanide hydratase and apolipoprotein N-acyltransferase [Desulfurivibrio alkaliphilus AHT 2]
MLRLIERVFSDCEDCPSVLLANMHITSDVELNLKRMEEVVQQAHTHGANILIFPELCVTGYVWEDQGRGEVEELLAAGENSRIAPTLKRIRDGLRDDGKGLEYVFFNNVRRKDDGLYNSTFILHHSLDYNREEFIYDKIFLPPLEQLYFKQGTDRRLTIETKWGSLGFLTCYDLCFVEMARKYALKDKVDAIVTMAHWRSEAVREYDRMNIMTDHYYGYLWNLMNSSKAAYNQVWSLAANAVGPHQVTGDYFWGGSGVWAPSGMKLIQASNITAELILVRNLDLRGQRRKEQDDFDYQIDFARFFKPIEEEGSCPQQLPLKS